MSEELKQQLEKLYDELPPFGDAELDARVKNFTIHFALSCASQVCEQREKEAKLELAQSRQQAVADAREEICELAETAAIGNSEPSRSTLLKLVQVIRSLTPPPALTKEK